MRRPGAAPSAQRYAWPFAGLAMLLIVLVPALWNGFPFIFPDTGGYLARPIEGTLELGRSALYGLLLLLGTSLDFWPVIAVQAALTIWLIALTMRCLALAHPLFVLAVIAALTVASAMPWYADTLMPDILLPDALLALYLLAFQAAQLDRAERVALIGVIACAIASHMATLALCLVLLPALLAARWLALPRARLSFVSIAVASGLVLAPVSNLAITGQFAFTPGGETFLFGRLVHDGIVARYLADRCPDPSIRLCAFKENLPKSADDWLWAPGNPIGELGGWRAYRPEARRIIFDTLRMYPAVHIVEAVRTTFEQLLLMKTEVSTVPDWLAPAVGALDKQTPALMPRLRASRQLAAPGPLDALLEALNVLHVVVAAVSIAGLAIIVALAPRRLMLTPSVSALAFVVLAALLANAAICGIFSNPVDRYQSRLVWLAPFALGLAALGRRTVPGASAAGGG